MPTCQAKEHNKPCKDPATKPDNKYCEKHKGFEKKSNTKASTGYGQGDTKDKTGKDQSHNKSAKGSGAHSGQGSGGR